MNINPGELKHSIQVIKMIKTQDEDGFDIEAEEIVRSCKAKISQRSSKEIFDAGADTSFTTKRFLVRFSKKEITTDMFVKYKGDYYQIEYTNNYEESNEYMEIIATLGER